MENFFNYITKPVRPEDVDVWFRSNNIIPEKLELFYDFTYSLNKTIVDTYLKCRLLCSFDSSTSTLLDQFSRLNGSI